jgi:inorganic triphosphatase YgiF
VTGEGSELEVALDAGDVHADGRDEAVCELEIELKSGEPAAAFETARKIANHIPLRLGVLSKAERGFALAEGLLDKVNKAGPVPVRPGMSVAEGFAVIVQSCLRHFRLNEPLVVKERNADALHQARVAIRRLRSALTLFRPAVADEEFDRLREELRWFTGQLGDARNLDVYLERDIPKQERKRLLRQREKAYDQLIEALNTRRFRLLMIDLMAFATVGEWRSGEKASRPLPDFAERRISRLWLKICGHDNIRSMGDEERHGLRIEIKKLRYALDFMQALHEHVGRRQKQFTKAIEALQGALGRLNDIVTARHFAEGEAAEDGSEQSVTDEEVKCIHEAQKCLNRLKLTGPYWTRSMEAAAS